MHCVSSRPVGHAKRPSTAPDGAEDTRVIGSIIDCVFAPDNPAAAVALLADPQIRIVCLTVTEGGYNIDNVSGQFVPAAG